jgi:hypothetical protein
VRYSVVVFQAVSFYKKYPRIAEFWRLLVAFFSRIQGHHINMGIFSPIVALGMTANVLLGPVAFFWPDFSRAVPTLMGYCT